MRRLILGGTAGAAALLGLAVWAGGEKDMPPLAFMGESVDGAVLERGREVYAENCASCHGAEREGQPDWRRRLENGRMPAPPHDETGHSWHHADGQLFTITKFGVGAVVPGYESDMPAFEGILGDDEIAAVLAYIKSTWPERERAFQAEVTGNVEGGS
ncbi:c-type cytochrome [Profundibacterium mesophilum]|uniref:Cytochrome c oxidase subunit II n=1 Tax=Profundibacterium mesophilum KAUST100406-0324 TaxID=1037889 RepID=A0A921TEB8_9RHOB|nr:cytochrome c [Profundibacterium mesophilum]KAF0677176.1 cytochrome c oxidase subunit II [Profundibacterium mesophilum KAUST100406-0324]